MAQLGSDIPFWGPVDAMHQFCEAKYVATPYVAEFWNAFSNIPLFICPGIFCLYRGRNQFDFRLMFLWANMVIVGIGSFMFHASMRFKWEMFDEVPMLMFILSGLLTKDDTHACMSGRWKIVVHSVCLILATGGMYMYLAMGVYEIFLHTFTILVLIDAAVLFVCTREPDKRGSHVARSLLYAYAVTMVSGKVIWEAEVQFCPPGSGGSLSLLHVLWHFFAGLASYFGGLADVHIRYAALGVGTAVDTPTQRWPLVGIVDALWCYSSGSAPGGKKSH